MTGLLLPHALSSFGAARHDQLRHFGPVLPPGCRLVMPEETTKATTSIYPTPGGCVLGPRDRTREKGCLLGAGRVWGAGVAYLCLSLGAAVSASRASVDSPLPLRLRRSGKSAPFDWAALNPYLAFAYSSCGPTAELFEEVRGSKLSLSCTFDYDM